MTTPERYDVVAIETVRSGRRSWPNRGELDARPPLESTYRQRAPVPPRNPVVPGALRLPVIT